MFDGVPDQFHQFITPRTSLPLHLPFPLHASGTPNTNFSTNFDPYNPSHQLPPLQQPNNNLLHPLHHHHNPSTHKNEDKEENNTIPPMNFQIQRDHQRQQQQQQLPELVDPWTNDEVLALLRIRSSMENWFPELTWEHVSRKLAELGYKKSAEKCKEKFEEETRCFNNNINYTKNNNNNNSNNFRFISELEQLYQGGGGDHQIGTTEEESQPQEGDSRNVAAKRNDETMEKTTMKEKKRKRPDRFEMFKGFCESIVHNMMAQQEEMHNKLIEDMVKRDEEKFTKEDAWKKQEMEKMNKELEMMAREQAIAGDRQANIIQILNKFSTTSATNSPSSHTLKVTNKGSSNLTTQIAQNPNALPNPTSSLAPDTLQVFPSSSSTSAPVPHRNPSSSSLQSQNNNNNKNPKETNSVLNKGVSNEKDDVGRRWPKDEVLALINLRCTSVNNNNNEEKEGNKTPLWERISQGMLELGYKRSSKRCKEKWENINKYFRKTKDVNKKRSLDSRTCPYFHQLSTLYNQGKLVLQSERSDNNNPPENLDEGVSQDQTQADESSSQVGSGGGFSVQEQQVDHGGEKPLNMQVPSLDFDQF